MSIPTVLQMCLDMELLVTCIRQMELALHRTNLLTFSRTTQTMTAAQFDFLQCHNGYGDNCFAQKLANILGVDVKAAPGWLQGSEKGFHKIWGTLFNSDGSLIPVPNLEEILDWIIFKPSK